VTRPRQRFRQAIRRWGYRVVFGAGLVTSSLAVIAIVLWNTPLVPYSPMCSRNGNIRSQIWSFSQAYYYLHIWGRARVPGRMATGYADLLAEQLANAGVSYVRVGNTILLNFRDWYTDPHLHIWNANATALQYLADHDYSPVWTDMPDDVRTLLARRLTAPLDPHHECEIVRALAIENWGR